MDEQYQQEQIDSIQDFLNEVWQATSDSSGNKEIVYPILVANQDKLDRDLVEPYRNWTNNILSQAIPEQTLSFAAVLLYFSYLIQQFSLGNKASNLDIAIIGYELALSIYNRENFPENWARTQSNLGNAYSDKITGNKAENIDTAIRCYELALSIYNRENFPENWARTQSNLGNAYSDKITGNKAENIDARIRCHELALEVYTREDFSEYWAVTQHNLGLAYSDKITGNKAENIDAEIRCYELVLEVRTRKDFPEKWAMYQYNLGLAYYSKITGNLAENIDTAIQYYELALEVRTRKDFPEKWADVQHNLGSAYYRKTTRNRAKNIDIAIQCYELALEVYTRENFPEDWVKTQNNLGSAYYKRITGDKAKNIDAAIRCYGLTLEVYTCEDFPKDWARTQFYLGNAYSDKITGNKAENIDTAIQCYQLALEVYTHEDFPKHWAVTQNNLGRVYKVRITGNKAENIDTAIRYYQLALEVYTREGFPKDWANTQRNLGDAYSNRITGNEAENIDTAIRCYELALAVCTREEFPEHWAGTQNQLGIAYCKKIAGNKAENIDTGIRCHELALEVYTREDFPKDWAMTQHNLGVNYYKKITGNKAKNIDTAIRYYEMALEVYTHDVFPEHWANIQYALGNTYYYNKINDNPTKNVDTAIRYYQLALEVHTRKDFPEKWAHIQTCLGGAYYGSDNLDIAVTFFQRALEVYTREDFPEKWAMIQNNIGDTYQNISTGDLCENLDTAITFYHKALEVYTREDFPEKWAKTQRNLGDICSRVQTNSYSMAWMTQRNLGEVYSGKTRGDKAENIDAIIAYYQRALEVYTREDFPEKWADIHADIGRAYWNYSPIGQYDTWGKMMVKVAEYKDIAITYFRLALKGQTPTTRPLSCKNKGLFLGSLASEKGLWEIAIEGYEVAIIATERERSLATTDDSRQQILNTYDFYGSITEAYINIGNLEKAIEYLERYRSRYLVDLIASNDLYSGGEVSPQVQAYLQHYDQIQAAIDAERKRIQDDSDFGKREIGKNSFALTRAALEAATVTIESLEAQKQQVWEKMRRLDPVLAGGIQIDPIDFSTIQQLIEDTQTAILDFYGGNRIFIIYKNKSPQLYTCESSGYNFHELVDDEWLNSYLNNIETWLTNIPNFLRKIAKELRLPELVKTHLAGIKELIIIPHSSWHHIPFAALPLGNSTQCLGNKFRIRYIPSTQILQYCQQRPALTEINYGTVEDADGSLRGAAFEGEKIAKICHIPNTQRLRGKTQATVNNYRQLAKQVQVLHCSHHASSRLDNPLESTLNLADGNITLGQIMSPGFRLPNLSDVFLSCCETSLGVANTNDNILSFSTGFLCAGARSVVSTLWSVDDLATAQFSIFYYQHRQQGLNRPESLRQAQNDLRTLDFDQLKTTIEQEFKAANQARGEAREKLKKADKNSSTYLQLEIEVKNLTTVADALHYLKTKRLPTYNQQTHPFASPFYWAAFICSGLS